jgi:PAS domain S-box-containing protein
MTESILVEPTGAEAHVTANAAAAAGPAAELAASELLQALPAAVYTTDAEGRLTFYNAAAIELWGHEPELGVSQWCGSWKLAWPDGRPMAHHECPMAVALKENRPVRGGEAIAIRPDGTEVPFIPYPTPLRDADGRLVGAVNMLVDITDRKRAEETQRTLLAELNHRVKNTLATVQSLAAQTMGRSGAAAEARRDFERRLLALSNAHDHLSRSGWEAAELTAVLGDVFGPFRTEAADPIRLAGEPVALPPRTAVTLALALHELATNAAKYGALSRPEGTVSVAWRVEPTVAGRLLLIDWTEEGGPPVVEPVSRGFGLRLVERGLTRELSGAAQITFEPAGLRGSIQVPL